MEKHKNTSSNEVSHLKRNDARRIFYDIKQTLGESTPAYSTDAKWHAEFKGWKLSGDDLH